LLRGRGERIVRVRFSWYEFSLILKCLNSFVRDQLLQVNLDCHEFPCSSVIIWVSNCSVEGHGLNSCQELPGTEFFLLIVPCACMCKLKTVNLVCDPAYNVTSTGKCLLKMYSCECVDMWYGIHRGCARRPRQVWIVAKWTIRSVCDASEHRIRILHFKLIKQYIAHFYVVGSINHGGCWKASDLQAFRVLLQHPKIKW